jgi:hypothetical protein
MVPRWLDHNLVHGDIKPENIVIRLPPHTTARDGDTTLHDIVAYLIDIGGVVRLQAGCPSASSSSHGSESASSERDDGAVLCCALHLWQHARVTAVTALRRGAGPLLPSFTDDYVVDPHNPVATRTSDLYALGITVKRVAQVRLGCCSA